MNINSRLQEVRHHARIFHALFQCLLGESARTLLEKGHARINVTLKVHIVIAQLHLALARVGSTRFKRHGKDVLDPIGRIGIGVVPLVEVSTLLAGSVGEDALFSLLFDRLPIEVVEAKLTCADGTLWRKHFRVDCRLDVQSDLR